MHRSEWSVRLVTYQGACVIVRRSLDWYRCIAYIFDLLAQPQSAMPYVHMGFSTVLYISSLFSSERGEFFPISQITQSKHESHSIDNNLVTLAPNCTYEVWSKSTVTVQIKKKYCSKRHIAINPPQNTPPRFEHTYPIILATFWSSSGSPLSWVSLAVPSWLPRYPESIQNVYLSWLFWHWGRARSRTVPYPLNKVDEGTP